VKRGSALRTDKFASYGGLSWRGFPHAAIPLSGDRDLTRRYFPWVHILLSNLKRFLLGTHHKVEQKHLPHYVAEFNYRLNRRSMEPDLMVRLLRACISTQAITYKQLIAMPEVS